MTGRPHNLERRNAVYYVRLWPPKRLAEQIRVRELRRSLGTKDYALAKIRCKAAVQWFGETVEWLEGLVTASRGELEKAANAYFQRLIAGVDQPRNFANGTYEDEISFQIEQSRAFIEQKENNLREHKYGDGTRSAAHQMLSAIGLDFGALDASAQLTASNYAERAERQRMRYFLHSIERPVEAFVSDDHLFAPAPLAPQAAVPLKEAVQPTIIRPDITLERGINFYIAYQTKKGWQGSMKDESHRVLRWLTEEVGDEIPVSAITQDQLREFRDCIQSLAPGHQGRKKALRERLATAGQPTLRFATKERYWRAIKAFFAYFRSDYSIPDPVADMLFEGGKNEVRRSPAPFSSDELQKLLKTSPQSGAPERGLLCPALAARSHRSFVWRVNDEPHRYAGDPGRAISRYTAPAS